MDITFKMGVNTLDKTDFDLNKEYEMFDVIYSVSKGINDHEVKAWTVVGHVLQSSSEKRRYETELCSYPISVFVQQNTWIPLSKLSHDFVSRKREEVVEQKKALLNDYFNDQLSKLK
jgi:hypothetical protein